MCKASQKLANAQLTEEEKVRALRLMAGFSSNKEARRQVKSDKLPVIMQIYQESPREGARNSSQK